MNSKPILTCLHSSILPSIQLGHNKSKSVSWMNYKRDWRRTKLRSSSGIKKLNKLRVSNCDSKSEEAIYSELMIADEPIKQTQFPSHLFNDSSISKSRRDIHKWIYHYGSKFGQSELTIQIAMVYVDKLIWALKIRELELNKELWATTALIVSSKFIEHDLKLIRIDDIIIFLHNIEREDIVNWEKSLLMILNWELDMLCPAYFRGIILKELNETLGKEEEIFSHNDTLGKLIFNKSLTSF